MQLAIGGVNGVGTQLGADLLKTAGRDTGSHAVRAGWAVCAVTGLVASLAAAAPVMGQTHRPDVSRAFTMTALSQDLAATVLTLEPGIVGIQNIYHFTPKELQGYFCAAPNTCRAVDYLTLPGDNYNEMGADKLVETVRTLPAGTGPVILMGHSQGAQVIYSALRRWQADPSKAPDPALVSWVSIGNPDNPIGGIRNSFGNAQPRPAQTPYAGTEVIRQYDGWADWPDDPTNLLSVFNALAGMATVHPNYFDVDINNPANVRYTPDRPDGKPGNVTYVWVPNPVLPMVAGLGPLAPVLDPVLRPIVEAGYHRPVTIPAPEAQSAAAVPRSAAAVSSEDLQAPAPEAALTESASEEHVSVKARPRQRDRAERRNAQTPSTLRQDRRQG